MKPHLEVLWRIFHETTSADDESAVPALLFQARARESGGLSGDMKSQQEFYLRGNVPFTGDLSVEEQGWIANWIFKRVPGANGKFALNKFIGRATMAHACTIILAQRHQEKIFKKLKLSLSKSLTTEDTKKIWNEAFSIQQNKSRPPSVRFVDVDKECIADFERWLFEFSSRSGRAGNMQWGLDVGPCADEEMYYSIPDEWLTAKGSRDDRKKDLEVCFLL